MRTAQTHTRRSGRMNGAGNAARMVPHAFRAATLTESMDLSRTGGWERSRRGGDGTTPGLTVVVPVFNERETLEKFHRRLKRVMDAAPETYEIIYVDDGSVDGSLAWIRSQSRGDRRVGYLSLTRNFGQAAAIAAGLAASRGAGVITIDADLQNPPEEIPKLLAAFREGYELVYGVRTNRQDTALRRFCSLMVAKGLKRALHLEREPSLTAFMITHRRMVRAMNDCPEHTRFHPALAAWLGAKTAHVHVCHDRRHHGRSKYNYRRLIRTAVDLLTNYTRLPLTLATYFGALALLLGVGMAGRLLTQSSDGTGVPVWGSLVSVIGVLGGVQLMAIGALGAYVGRTHSQILGRPLYVVRETGGLRDGFEPRRHANAFAASRGPLKRSHRIEPRA